MSAGTGPTASMPAARAAAIAGAIAVISSRPRCPPSPACGLSPQTAMRGALMPKRAASSAWTIASVAPTASCVIAAATSFSARCVVTSATRSTAPAGPPTSSITTRGVCVRSAKYSVCPENAMPASISTLFCAGAVTSAAKAPVAQASAAWANVASTLRALAGSGTPGITGTASGCCQTSIVPAAGGAGEAGSNTA